MSSRSTYIVLYRGFARERLAPFTGVNLVLRRLLEKDSSWCLPRTRYLLGRRRRSGRSGVEGSCSPLARVDHRAQHEHSGL